MHNSCMKPAACSSLFVQLLSLGQPLFLGALLSNVEVLGHCWTRVRLVMFNGSLDGIFGGVDGALWSPMAVSVQFASATPL